MNVNKRTNNIFIATFAPNVLSRCLHLCPDDNVIVCFVLFFFLIDAHYSQDLLVLRGVVCLPGRLLRGHAAGLLPDAGPLSATVAERQRTHRN